MPDSNSWISHSISESAAQGIESAWLARLGFLLFSFGVIWIVRLAPPRWEVASRMLFLAIGVLICAAAAAFSHRPWESGAPSDATEDLLHSIAATGMGFAFAFGVVTDYYDHSITNELNVALPGSELMDQLGTVSSFGFWLGPLQMISMAFLFTGIIIALTVIITTLHAQTMLLRSFADAAHDLA